MVVHKKVIIYIVFIVFALAPLLWYFGIRKPTEAPQTNNISQNISQAPIKKQENPSTEPAQGPSAEKPNISQETQKTTESESLYKLVWYNDKEVFVTDLRFNNPRTIFTPQKDKAIEWLGIQEGLLLIKTAPKNKNEQNTYTYYVFKYTPAGIEKIKEFESTGEILNWIKQKIYLLKPREGRQKPTPTGTWYLGPDMVERYKLQPPFPQDMVLTVLDLSTGKEKVIKNIDTVYVPLEGELPMFIPVLDVSPEGKIVELRNFYMFAGRSKASIIYGLRIYAPLGGNIWNENRILLIDPDTRASLKYDLPQKSSCDPFVLDIKEKVWITYLCKTKERSIKGMQYENIYVLETKNGSLALKKVYSGTGNEIIPLKDHFLIFKNQFQDLEILSLPNYQSVTIKKLLPPSDLEPSSKAFMIKNKLLLVTREPSSKDVTIQGPLYLYEIDPKEGKLLNKVEIEPSFSLFEEEYSTTMVEAQEAGKILFFQTHYATNPQDRTPTTTYFCYSYTVGAKNFKKESCDSILTTKEVELLTIQRTEPLKKKVKAPRGWMVGTWKRSPY